MAFDCPHRGGHVGNVMGCVVPIGPMVWASYGSSNIFRHGGRPPFWILKIFNIWYVTVIGVLICCGVPNFIKIGSRIRPPDAHNFWMFNAPLLGNGRCRGNRIMAAMLDIMGCDHTSFFQIGPLTGDRVIAFPTFFNMAAVRHLEFEFCYSGPSTKSITRFDYRVKIWCRSDLSRRRYCDFIILPVWLENA